MQRGSSVNFQPVHSATHAVTHASREVAPTYLLPPEHSMGTIVLLDDKGGVSKTLEAKMALASRQAKAVEGYSPLWEGVLNLRRPEINENPKAYKKECGEVVKEWCKKYQEMTGHKVLRADVHLDEGHIIEGVAMLNAHAHIICDKTNDKGRVIKLTPQNLRELQTATAQITNLERGVNSRVSGKKHITAHQYKYLAERGQLESQVKLDDLKVKHEAELTQLKAQYQAERAQLKASGEATQQAYQALKKAHDQALADLTKTQTEAAKVPKLEAQINALKPQAAKVPELEKQVAKATQTATEAQTLIAQYQRDREALKASGEAKQKDYQALKKAHDQALADLTKATQQAAKVPALEADLSKEKANSDYYSKLVDSQNQRSAEQSEKLKTAKVEAAKVPALEAQITQQVAAFDKLKADAMAVINPLKQEVKTMKTQITQLEAENAKLAADVAKFATIRNNYQAEKAAGVNPALIVPDPVPRTSQSNKPVPLTPAPIPREATRTASEAPKRPVAPIAPPKPIKSIAERLAASWEAMVGWIKSIGAEQEPITANSRHDGPVKQLDDLHCVQKTGRRYAVHRLADLDNTPALDDPRMSIRYKDGKGTVHGQLGKPGVQI